MQREALEEFLRKEEVKKIEKDFKILNEFTSVMKDMSSWTKFVDKPDSKIYYKKEEGLSPITCFIETTINAPVLNAVAICAEVAHYKEWLPITPVSDVIKELTPLRKLIYLRNAL